MVNLIAVEQFYFRIYSNLTFLNYDGIQHVWAAMTNMPEHFT